MLYILLLVQTFNFTGLPDTWQTDYDQAVELASDQNKDILVVFAGSDWCAPCKKLKKNILITEEFQQYETDNIVVLYLDFPSKKKNRLSKERTKHNEALADKYNRSGSFPYIVLLNKTGETLKTIKYKGQSTSDFITALQ